MEKTIKIINQMRDEQVFSSYAICGGIAALFYIEPVTTFDLDVFIIIPGDTGAIVSLSSIYSWLGVQGYKYDKEQVVIEGVPVQFIPVYNSLINDAVQNSIQKQYGSTNAWVVSAEYLMAIMVQTYRPRDRDRLVRFLDETKINEAIFSEILEKYNLKNAFKEFKRNHYGK